MLFAKNNHRRSRAISGIVILCGVVSYARINVTSLPPYGPLFVRSLCMIHFKGGILATINLLAISAVSKGFAGGNFVRDH